jgi:hypothetical protein
MLNPVLTECTMQCKVFTHIYTAARGVPKERKPMTANSIMRRSKQEAASLSNWPIEVFVRVAMIFCRILEKTTSRHSPPGWPYWPLWIKRWSAAWCIARCPNRMPMIRLKSASKRWMTLSLSNSRQPLIKNFFGFHSVGSTHLRSQEVGLF